MGGVNLVSGFRPELWKEAAPDDAPAQIEGFNHDVIGIDDFTMPATQHDAVLWISGMAYDVIFDVSRQAIAARLDISDQTVKSHVASIGGKLGAANRTEAVRMAVRQGLITL
jgi:hypothetical protein